MLRPDLFYLAALALAIAIEAGFAARRRDAFGPVLWVIVAVTAIAYAFYFGGYSLPHVQFALHLLALPIAAVAARGVVGIVASSLFFPMAAASAVFLAGGITDVTWWWTLFYLACLQLAVLGAGANFHRLGRAIRAWSDQLHHRLERALWGEA